MDNGCINISIQEYRKLKGLPPLKEYTTKEEDLVTTKEVVTAAMISIKEQLNKDNK